MKKFLPAIGMIIVIAGGVAGGLVFLVSAGQNGLMAGPFGFIIGASIVFFILKWFLPDFIENEESKKVPMATGKHWLLVLIFVFAVLVYLTGVGIDW